MVAFRFKPMEIPNQEPRPAFWRVRPQEIVDLCERASKCSRKEIIARTPLGHPVYALFYGDFNDAPPQTNWSAGSSSTTWRNYLGDPPPAKETFLLLAGVHGAEAEGVAAAVNLIQCLETGADFRGDPYRELVNLISHYRFIVVPCVNMDGRSLSPDHLRGANWHDFRAASQGVWKDGSLIGWRGSKAWFPLPLDKVSFPGGYPNGDGYNIMHDATPGDIRTAEARGLLRLAARWRVDAVLNAHSCEYAPSVSTNSWSRCFSRSANILPTGWSIRFSIVATIAFSKTERCITPLGSSARFISRFPRRSGTSRGRRRNLWSLTPDDVTPDDDC